MQLGVTKVAIVLTDSRVINQLILRCTWHSGYVVAPSLDGLGIVVWDVGIISIHHYHSLKGDYRGLEFKAFQVMENINKIFTLIKNNYTFLSFSTYHLPHEMEYFRKIPECYHNYLVIQKNSKFDTKAQEVV